MATLYSNFQTTLGSDPDPFKLQIEDESLVKSISLGILMREACSEGIKSAVKENMSKAQVAPYIQQMTRYFNDTIRPLFSSSALLPYVTAPIHLIQKLLSLAVADKTGVLKKYFRDEYLQLTTAWKEACKKKTIDSYMGFYERYAAFLFIAFSTELEDLDSGIGVHKYTKTPSQNVLTLTHVGTIENLVHRDSFNTKGNPVYVVSYKNDDGEHIQEVLSEDHHQSLLKLMLKRDVAECNQHGRTGITWKTGCKLLKKNGDLKRNASTYECKMFISEWGDENSCRKLTPKLTLCHFLRTYGLL